MISKIAFSGYENVSADMRMKGSKPNLSRVFLKLNNENDFKDLDNFKDVFQKFPDKKGSNDLKIEAGTNKTGGTSFAINDKILEKTPENAGIFEKVFNLLHNVEVNPKAKMNYEYRFCGGVLEKMAGGLKFADYRSDVARYYAEQVTKPENISNSAKFINDKLEKVISRLSIK